MITVDGVSKAYGGHLAIDDVSFAPAPGRITGFLGSDGAGKSTTMRVMVGLTPPTTGRVLFDGHRYADLPNPGLFVGVHLHADGRRNRSPGRRTLTTSARTMGLPTARIPEILELVGLPLSDNRPRVGSAPADVRLRLGLAHALLGDPPILILDEPQRGIEPAGVDRSFVSFVAAAAGPQNVLLPVLGIVVISIGWTRGAAATAYTLMPVRHRMLLAQLFTVLIIGSAAIALALGLAALAALPSGRRSWSEFGADNVPVLGLVQVIALLQGAAFGLLFLNLSSAILGHLAVPVGIDLLSSLWTPLGGARPWWDLWAAQQPLLKAAPIGREQWLHLATSTGVWVVLPFVIGAIRLHRVDIP